MNICLKCNSEEQKVEVVELLLSIGYSYCSNTKLKEASKWFLPGAFYLYQSTTGNHNFTGNPIPPTHYNIHDIEEADIPLEIYEHINRRQV